MNLKHILKHSYGYRNIKKNRCEEEPYRAFINFAVMCKPDDLRRNLGMAERGSEVRERERIIAMLITVILCIKMQFYRTAEYFF